MNRNQFPLAAYVLPVLPNTMLLAPLAIIQGVYAKHYGLTLASLAMVILISRVVDAFTDPWIGRLSDKYYARKGTRKPFILSGGVLLLLCAFFLYSPMVPVTIYYFGIWTILFYVGYTLFEIPHLTYPCDHELKANEISFIYSIRVAIGYAGLALFYAIPLLPIFATDDITPQTLRYMFWIAVFIGIPALMWLGFTLNGESHREAKQPRKKPSTIQFHRVVREIISDRLLMMLFLALAIKVIGSGMWYGLIFIYVDAHLSMGEEFAEMFLIAFIVGLAISPLWGYVLTVFDKVNVLLFAMLLSALSFYLTIQLKPGYSGFYDLLALKTIQTAAFSAMSIIIPSILAELIEKQRQVSGDNRNALIFSAKVFIEKSFVAAGIAIGLAIAGAFGVNPENDYQSGEAVFGLHLAMAWIPIGLAATSIIIIFFFGRLFRKSFN